MRSLPLTEISLRARSTADNRQIGQLTTKERGLKAAHDVLMGTLSPEDSKSQWQVNSDCLRYYRKLLQRQGLERLRQPRLRLRAARSASVTKSRCIQHAAVAAAGRRQWCGVLQLGEAADRGQEGEGGQDRAQQGRARRGQEDPRRGDQRPGRTGRRQDQVQRRHPHPSSRWTSSSRRCPSRVWPAPTR